MCSGRILRSLGSVENEHHELVMKVSLGEAFDVPSIEAVAR